MAVLVYKGKKYTVSEAHPACAKLDDYYQSKQFERLLVSMSGGFLPQHPIIRRKADGRIIDGRHREAAAVISEVDPVYRDVDWTDEAIREYVSRNAIARLWSETQFAAYLVQANLDEIQHNGGRKMRVRELGEAAGTGEKTASKILRTLPELLPLVELGPKNGGLSAEQGGELSDFVRKQEKEKGAAEAAKVVNRVVHAASPKAETAKILGTSTHGGKREKKPEPEVESGTPLDGSAPPPKPQKVEKKSEEIKDKLGQVCPPSVRDTFGDPALPELLSRMRAVESESQAIRELLKKVWAGKQESYPFCHWKDAHDSLSTVVQEIGVAVVQLAAGEPYCVCPKCKGEQCDKCGQTGYWPKYKHDSVG